MKCEQMHELFSPYLDKMTGQKETESVEAHLQECAACQKHLADMRIMCNLLKNMDVPQIPERFSVDLHKRLADEKIKIFTTRQLITPKKSGWLAAGVAGIALTIGIFASSFMPMGMVASLQNWINGDNEKPPAVIDNDQILKDWAKKHNSGQIAANLGDNPAANTSPVSTPSKDPIKVNTETPAASSSNPVKIALKERVVDDYAAKINVSDMNSTVEKLKEIADANGARYSLQSGRTMISASASSAKVIALQVPKENVDQVISSLVAMGMTVPVKDSTDYTDAYAEAEKALNDIDSEIAKYQSSDLTAAQEQQLKQLQDRQNDLLAEKQRIDKEYNLVTILVRLVEDINP